jgi:hypothetical protein
MHKLWEILMQQNAIKLQTPIHAFENYDKNINLSLKIILYI